MPEQFQTWVLLVKFKYTHGFCPSPTIMEEPENFDHIYLGGGESVKWGWVTVKLGGTSGGSDFQPLAEY